MGLSCRVTQIYTYTHRHTDTLPHSCHQRGSVMVQPVTSFLRLVSLTVMVFPLTHPDFHLYGVFSTDPQSFFPFNVLKFVYLRGFYCFGFCFFVIFLVRFFFCLGLFFFSCLVWVFLFFGLFGLFFFLVCEETGAQSRQGCGGSCDSRLTFHQGGE